MGGDPRPHDRTFLAVSAIGRVSEQLPDHVGPRLPAPARQRAVLQACRTSTHRRVEAAPREGWHAPRPRPPSRTRPRNASAGREAGPSGPDGHRVHRQPLPGRPPHRCSPAQSPGLRPFAAGGGLPPRTAGPSCPSPLEASARAAPAASRRGSCFRLLLLFFRGDAAVASGSVTSEGEPLLGDQARRSVPSTEARRPAPWAHAPTLRRGQPGNGRPNPQAGARGPATARLERGQRDEHGRPSNPDPVAGHKLGAVAAEPGLGWVAALHARCWPGTLPPSRHPAEARRDTLAISRPAGTRHPGDTRRGAPVSAGQGRLTCATVGPGGGPGPPLPSASSSWGSRGGRPPRSPPAGRPPGTGRPLVAVRPPPPAAPGPRSCARGPGAAPVAAPPVGGRCLCLLGASSASSSASQEGRPPPPPPSPAPAALPSASSSSFCTGSGEAHRPRAAGVQGP